MQARRRGLEVSIEKYVHFVNNVPYLGCRMARSWSPMIGPERFTALAICLSRQ